MIWASDTFCAWAVGLYAIITPGLCALPGYIGPDGSLTNLLLTLSPELVLIFHLDLTTLREDTWVSMLLLGHCMGCFLPVAMRLSPHQRMKKSGLSGCGLMVETVQ